MKVSDTVTLQSDDGGDRVEVEIVVTSRDGEQAVEWVEEVEAAVEDALPEEWY
ncbi:MAG TPA: hypothetical protein VFJ06_02210 [Halococcus sp.]|nr:hypothetical protein [Halococcus sp.]